MDMPGTMIGVPVAQIAGPDKVTGRTRFAADVEVPGMLWGKILRSPHPHARICRMDASAAWRVPGVKAVVTGQDAPGHLMGKVLRDMPVLCWDRVGPWQGRCHLRPADRGQRVWGRGHRRGGRHFHRPQSDGGCRHGHPHPGAADRGHRDAGTAGHAMPGAGLMRPPDRRPFHAVVASAAAGPGPSPGTPGRRGGTTPARS
jgi:Aldehyde oxidase and xanthine dehydrogenase, a/b hammerhead domain